MKSLFGKNINNLRGSKENVLSKSTFSAGVYSVLGLLTNSFSISVCVLPPQFVNGLLIINPLFEKLCDCYATGKPMHLQIFILASFSSFYLFTTRIFRLQIERIIFPSL